MAVPQNAQRFRMAPLKTGVMLGVSPSSDPTFDMEIARATSSGVYTTITRLTGKGSGVPVVYTDILPVDNKTRSYKARAVKDGWLEGDYTSIVSAKPVEMPEIVPNVTPLTGKGIGSPLFVSTAAPPQFGQAVATQKYDKSIAFYPFQFTSTSIGATYQASPQYLWPLSTAARAFYAPFTVAPNASVTDLTFQYRRPSTKGTVRFRIQSLSPSTITSTIIDYTATGSGANIITKTFSSGFTVGSLYYFVRVDLTSTIASSASVRIRGLAANYAIPSVSVGV